MKTTEILFWSAMIIVLYTYLGYPIILYIGVRIKRLTRKPVKKTSHQDLPMITLLVAAYNEEEYVDEKVKNSLSLEYPKDKLKLIWITDGSNDNTNKLLEKYKTVQVLHEPARKGKIAAINRAMKHVETPIVVFSDANTLLGVNSIKIIAELFTSSKVGCVSGEKRVFMQNAANAAEAGEGLYWKYESALKKWDAELNTAVGAAGELFAIRSELYKEVEPDTLLDDFIISLRVAMKGYKIAYNPNAYALERASASTGEELKRKIRIAAGGFQSIVRLLPLLNIFRYKTLSFQYISHRVFRWTAAPISLLILIITNIILVNHSPVFNLFLFGQVFFYFLVSAGWLTQKLKLKIKVLFVPYYFILMNYAAYRGLIRYIFNNQSVNWEKVKRTSPV